MTEAEWLNSTDPVWMVNALLGASNTNPVPKHLVDFKVSDRKLRLYACACCRQVWNSFGTNARQCVQAAENAAEGLCPPLTDYGSSIMSRVLDRAVPVGGDETVPEIERRSSSAAACCHWDNFNRQASLMRILRNTELLGISQAIQANILRDIVGNPFRPIIVRHRGGSVGGQGLENLDYDEPWLTDLVLSLTQAAYDNYNPDDRTLSAEHLAILNDALIDAGCDKAGDAVSITKDIETLNFLMARCYTDSAFREYQKNLDGLYRKLDEANKQHPILVALQSPGPHWVGFWVLDLLLGKE